MNTVATQNRAWPRLRRRGLRVETLCRLWMEDVRPRVKPSTITRYDAIVRNHIAPFFRDATTAGLTPELVEDFAEQGLAELSPKSACDIISVLRSILQFGQREGYLTGPMPALQSPHVDRREMRVLSREEQKRLEGVLTDPSLEATGLLLCLYTGLRLGEVCGLKWGDIDLRHRVLTVRRTVQRLPREGGRTELYVGPPKTECSHRSIPLPPFLVQRLSAYRKDNECYVLTGQPDKPMQPRTYQYMFKRYLARAKVADANFHALRHTFATRCVEAGFDPKSLSELLGHASVNITLNRYVHASLDWKRKQMNKLKAFV